MKALLELMVKELVDLPDEVRIEEIAGSETTVFEVKCAKSDLGKVIGKEGRNVRALRTILSAVATKHNKRAILSIPAD